MGAWSRKASTWGVERIVYVIGGCGWEGECGGEGEGEDPEGESEVEIEGEEIEVV